MREQRRSRVIAMSEQERDAFLGVQRTCRLASLGPGGPHVSPVWFVWDGAALWVYSLTRSQRWTDIQRDPRVAAVIDAGEHYHELHGVEIEGEAVVVGPVPRAAAAEPRDPRTGRTRAPDGRQVPASRREHDPRRPSRLAADNPRQDHQLGLPQAGKPARPELGGPS